MLQHAEPDDYVIATGETHSVREFLELAFEHAGLDWEPYVEIDPRYFRPDRGRRAAAATPRRRARCSAGSRRCASTELVRIMVEADIAALEEQLAGKVERYSHEGTG